MTRTLAPRHPRPARARRLAALALLLGLLAACVAGPAAVPQATGTPVAPTAAPNAPRSTPAPTAPPTVIATATPGPHARLILPAAGDLTPAEQQALTALIASPPAEWGMTASMDAQPGRTEEGYLTLTLLETPTDQTSNFQPVGRIIILDAEAKSTIAIVDLADAQAVAQQNGLPPVSYIEVDSTGRVVGADATGQAVVIFDLAANAWGPVAPPELAPTATPATPEQPAGMIQFDGYTIAYDTAKSQWVQKNEKGAVRTVWNEAAGKWEIPASVKSIEIGPEGVDHGLVVALSVEEIRKLMEQQPGRLPLPIRLNDVEHVEIKEGASPKAPFLLLNGNNGLGGISIINVVDGLCEKGGENRGDDGGKHDCLVWIERDKGDNVMYYFPGNIGQLYSSGQVTFGTILATYPQGSSQKMDSASPTQSGNEFAWSGKWSDRRGKQLFAQLEDTLTNPQGQPVIFQ